MEKKVEYQKCQRCQNDRLLWICVKTRDGFSGVIKDKAYSGYIPPDIGINDEFMDYLQFHFCLNCGQVQGNYPLPITMIEKGEIESSTDTSDDLMIDDDYDLTEQTDE
jgi:hypothetical protein